MVLKLLIRLSALSWGLTYVACTTPQQQSQLATLHERMNQLISSLYSSPLLSKVQTASSSSEEASLTSSPQEATYSYPASAPQIVYVAPPSYLEPGVQPIDYGYSAPTNPVARSAWPYYEYSNYQLQPTPPGYMISRLPYPDYSRDHKVYPQIAAPPSPLPAALPYPALPYAQYSSPVPLPAPVYPPLPISGPVPLLSGPYAPQLLFQQPPVSAAYPPNNYPLAFPPPLPTAYPSLPPTSFASPLPLPPPLPYAPPLPALTLPAIQYPSPVPSLYGSIPVPYSPLIPYPQAVYSPTPAYPKPIEILPQPQYDYNL